MNFIWNISYKWFVFIYSFCFSDALAIEGAQPEQGRKRATKQRTPKKIQQNPVYDA